MKSFFVIFSANTNEATFFKKINTGINSATQLHTKTSLYYVMYYQDETMSFFQQIIGWTKRFTVDKCWLRYISCIIHLFITFLHISPCISSVSGSMSIS